MICFNLCIINTYKMILFNYIIYLSQIQQVIKEKKYGITTTRKESTSEGKMPSQKFKYRRKRLLARVYGPRRPSYLFLLLKEILRPCLHKQIIYEGNLLSFLNKFAFANILPNDEKSRRLIFSEGEQSLLTTICEDLYTLAISYLRISN